MAKLKPILERHIVIQFGGTSSEQYLFAFKTRKSAESYIRRATQNSYNCLGPFNLPLGEFTELANAAVDTISWLRACQLDASNQFKQLERSLASL